MPETAREIVKRLEAIPFDELTNEQVSALNRARWAVKGEEEREERRRAKGKAPAIEPDDAQDTEGVDGAEGEDSAVDASDPQDARAHDAPIPAGALLGHAELETEARRLYARSLKNLETILGDKRATNQDRLQAASHLRLAASIGQSEPAPTVYRLPMASLLGADGPRQDSTAPEVPDSPPLSHETRQRGEGE